VPRLANPANDAVDIAAMFEELGFKVTKLVDANLNFMEAARRDFAEQARGAAFRIFYFSGHGVQAEGQNWLLPVDADIKAYYERNQRAFSAQAVPDGLKAAGPGINLVILDVCRDNPLCRAGCWYCTHRRARHRTEGASRRGL
jgi:uncharacterized caspase-like protein